MSATKRFTVMVGVTTMALLSWAAMVSAGGGNCPADAMPKPLCPESANLVSACFSQEKFCDAAAQLLADPNVYNDANKKCSQQVQTCYADAAKLCMCVSSGQTGGVAPTVGVNPGRGMPATGGATSAPIYVPNVTVPSWIAELPAGQRGAGGRAGTETAPSGLKCFDGSLIPQEPSLLKVWLEAGAGGADPTDNDIDRDGVPDYKLKAKSSETGGAGLEIGGYIKDYNVQCDTCVKYANVCSGPEGGVAGKESCYNPSQKTDICK